MTLGHRRKLLVGLDSGQIVRVIGMKYEASHALGSSPVPGATICGRIGLYMYTLRSGDAALEHNHATAANRLPALAVWHTGAAGVASFRQLFAKCLLPKEFFDATRRLTPRGCNFSSRFVSTLLCLTAWNPHPCIHDGFWIRRLQCMQLARLAATPARHRAEVLARFLWRGSSRI